MDYIPQSVKWLAPEEPSPCDIFLHFRGQYAIAVSAGQPFTIPTLTKFAKAGYAHVYVRKSDLPTWQSWAARRHPAQGPAPAQPRSEEKAAEAKSRYGNKRAELQSYLQKVITAKNQSAPELGVWQRAMDSVQRVCKSPMLDWYFQQFHEPPDLLHHNGRVAFGSAAFCYLHGVGGDKEIDNLIFSALLHEQEGDPVTSLNTVVSQATLASLERNQRPVPQEVIQLIRLHDELCSGAGFPKNLPASAIPPPVRVFTLFNHFDHYRLQATGTRRTRLERVKQQMMARKQDYDATLFGYFWEFWEKHAEIVG